MEEEKKSSAGPLLLALLFISWLVPGAGHFYLGKRVQGIIIFVVIGLLFWAGICMGGVMTVDVYHEPLWFGGQIMTGIHGLVGWHRHNEICRDMLNDDIFKTADPRTGEPPITRFNVYFSGRTPRQQQLADEYLQKRGMALVAPVDTPARAYSGVAGLLNLLCIFDCLMIVAVSASASSAASDDKKSARPADKAREAGKC